MLSDDPVSGCKVTQRRGRLDQLSEENGNLGWPSGGPYVVYSVANGCCQPNGSDNEMNEGCWTDTG